VIVAALAAAAVHAWRFARWRGWRTAGEPLLWCIHLGYAWLIVALLLRAAAELVPAVPRDAWIHAFTIGAYGMLKIGLMTRVALRHTGRPLQASFPMQAAFVMVLAASLLRLAYSAHGLGEWALAGSALLWAAAFVLYLIMHGPMLVQPGLPRAWHGCSGAVDRAGDWAERIAARDRGAIARAISAIENETADAAAVRKRSRDAPVTRRGGVWAAQVGKSTLVNADRRAARAAGPSRWWPWTLPAR
jgi:hypothetical protein